MKKIKRLYKNLVYLLNNDLENPTVTVKGAEIRRVQMRVRDGQKLMK